MGAHHPPTPPTRSADQPPPTPLELAELGRLRNALEQIRDLASQTLDAHSDTVADSIALAAILAIAEKGCQS